MQMQIVSVDLIPLTNIHFEPSHLLKLYVFIHSSHKTHFWVWTNKHYADWFPLSKIKTTLSLYLFSLPISKLIQKQSPFKTKQISFIHVLQ